jgi:hypothetical protein
MDRLTRTVRQQVALGRLLPLGRPGDTAWITERAAVALLRRAVAEVPGVRLGAASLAAYGPSADGEMPGAAPLGALPHVPLLIEADFEAVVTRPLPQSAERLREALWTAARDAVGLTVGAVDLEVTGLLEEEPGAPEPAVDDPQDPEPAVRGAAAAVDAAVRAVPGVLRLTGRLASLGPGVRLTDDPVDPQAPGAPRGRRVQVQIAVAAGHVPLAVARSVAAAAAAAAAADAPGPVSTAVVVT